MPNMQFKPVATIPKEYEAMLKAMATNRFTGNFNRRELSTLPVDHITRAYQVRGGIQTLVLADKVVVGLIYPRPLNIPSNDAQDAAVSCMPFDKRKNYWRLGNIYIDDAYRKQGLAKATLTEFIKQHTHVMYCADINNLASQAVAKSCGLVLSHRYYYRDNSIYYYPPSGKYNTSLVYFTS